MQKIKKKAFGSKRKIKKGMPIIIWIWPSFRPKLFFTTVRTHEGMVKVPLVVRAIMGQKIDVKDKVEQLMDSYSKSVIQSTSHNLIMAKLYGLKMASLAYVLSLIGVPPEELKKLKNRLSKMRFRRTLRCSKKMFTTWSSWKYWVVVIFLA